VIFFTSLRKANFIRDLGVGIGKRLAPALGPPSKTFPVQRANQLPAVAAQIPWLIQDLWTDQAVGILGGEPKCCKSFLALGIALAVASGSACLRRFPVRRSGPVLFFPAEDSLSIVRQRLDGLAYAGRRNFRGLPVDKPHTRRTSLLRQSRSGYGQAKR
jgi:AAA domain